MKVIRADNYALQAIQRASDPQAAQAVVAEERAWQRQRLIELGDEYDTRSVA